MRGRLTAAIAYCQPFWRRWFLSARQQATLYRRAIQSPPPGPTQVKTNVILRRQFFTWQEVESSDYRAYVANLREIGCPEQTIRDIIIADVNALYARKRATDPDIVTPEHQWWRTEPDTNALAVAAARIGELEEERPFYQPSARLGNR
jgi:hypothetical protein